MELIWISRKGVCREEERNGEGFEGAFWMKLRGFKWSTRRRLDAAQRVDGLVKAVRMNL